MTEMSRQGKLALGLTVAALGFAGHGALEPNIDEASAHDASTAPAADIYTRPTFGIGAISDAVFQNETPYTRNELSSTTGSASNEGTYSIKDRRYIERTIHDNKECKNQSLAASYTIRQEHLGRMTLRLKQVKEEDGMHGRWRLVGFKHICDVAAYENSETGHVRAKFVKMKDGVYEDPLSIDKVTDANAKYFIGQLTVWAK